MQISEKATDTSAVEQALIDLAVESWRICRTFQRIIRALDAGEQGRYRGHLEWFDQKLNQSLGQMGMRIENMEPGQRYEVGMAVEPINAADFEPGEELIVDQILEPTIVGPKGVKRGAVTLRSRNV